MGLLKKWSFRLLMLSLILVGCSLHKEILPSHDEVMTYELPYDLTFLRSFEALESIEGWDILYTDKAKGTIAMRNVMFSRFDDADLRNVNLQITRKNMYETQVQIAPGYQQVFGAGDLLENVRQYLDREV